MKSATPTVKMPKDPLAQIDLSSEYREPILTNELLATMGYSSQGTHILPEPPRMPVPARTSNPIEPPNTISNMTTLPLIPIFSNQTPEQVSSYQDIIASQIRIINQLRLQDPEHAKAKLVTLFNEINEKILPEVRGLLQVDEFHIPLKDRIISRVHWIQEDVEFQDGADHPYYIALQNYADKLHSYTQLIDCAAELKAKANNLITALGDNNRTNLHAPLVEVNSSFESIIECLRQIYGENHPSVQFYIEAQKSLTEWIKDNENLTNHVGRQRFLEKFLKMYVENQSTSVDHVTSQIADIQAIFLKIKEELIKKYGEESEEVKAYDQQMQSFNEWSKLYETQLDIQTLVSLGLDPGEKIKEIIAMTKGKPNYKEVNKEYRQYRRSNNQHKNYERREMTVSGIYGSLNLFLKSYSENSIVKAGLFLGDMFNTLSPVSIERIMSWLIHEMGAAAKSQFDLENLIAGLPGLIKAHVSWLICSDTHTKLGREAILNDVGVLWSNPNPFANPQMALYLMRIANMGLGYFNNPNRHIVYRYVANGVSALTWLGEKAYSIYRMYSVLDLIVKGKYNKFKAEDVLFLLNIPYELLEAAYKYNCLNVGRSTRYIPIYHAFPVLTDILAGLIMMLRQSEIKFTKARMGVCFSAVNGLIELSCGNFSEKAIQALLQDVQNALDKDDVDSAWRVLNQEPWRIPFWGIPIPGLNIDGIAQHAYPINGSRSQKQLAVLRHNVLTYKYYKANNLGVVREVTMPHQLPDGTYVIHPAYQTPIAEGYPSLLYYLSAVANLNIENFIEKFELVYQLVEKALVNEPGKLLAFLGKMAKLIEQARFYALSALFELNKENNERRQKLLKVITYNSVHLNQNLTCKPWQKIFDDSQKLWFALSQQSSRVEPTASRILESIAEKNLSYEQKLRLVYAYLQTDNRLKAQNVLYDIDLQKITTPDDIIHLAQVYADAGFANFPQQLLAIDKISTFTIEQKLEAATLLNKLEKFELARLWVEAVAAISSRQIRLHAEILTNLNSNPLDVLALLDQLPKNARDDEFWTKYQKSLQNYICVHYPENNNDTSYLLLLLMRFYCYEQWFTPLEEGSSRELTNEYRVSLDASKRILKSKLEQYGFDATIFYDSLAAQDKFIDLIRVLDSLRTNSDSQNILQTGISYYHGRMPGGKNDAIALLYLIKALQDVSVSSTAHYYLAQIFSETTVGIYFNLAAATHHYRVSAAQGVKEAQIWLATTAPMQSLTYLEWLELAYLLRLQGDTHQYVELCTGKSAEIMRSKELSEENKIECFNYALCEQGDISLFDKNDIDQALAYYQQRLQECPTDFVAIMRVHYIRNARDNIASTLWFAYRMAGRARLLIGDTAYLTGQSGLTKQEEARKWREQGNKLNSPNATARELILAIDSYQSARFLDPTMGVSTGLDRAWKAWRPAGQTWILPNSHCWLDLRLLNSALIADTFFSAPHLKQPAQTAEKDAASEPLDVIKEKPELLAASPKRAVPKPPTQDDTQKMRRLNKAVRKGDLDSIQDAYHAFSKNARRKIDRGHRGGEYAAFFQEARARLDISELGRRQAASPCPR